MRGLNKRLELLREIGNSREIPISRMCCNSMTIKSVFKYVDEFVDRGLIRISKEKNMINCELTDRGRCLLLCENPSKELKEEYNGS